MSWLYRAEVKGIQSWILATGRLREIRGGSTIIEGLDTEAKARLMPTGALEQAAAGGVSAVFDDEAALKAFASEWPMYVDRRAPGLQVVQAWVKQEGSPADVEKELQKRLGARRNEIHPSLPEAGPLLARAPRTGLPGMFGGRTDAGREDTLDRATSLKLHQGDGKVADALAARLWPGRSVRFDEDLSGWKEGSVAVVHVDGNGIGGLLQTMDRAQRRRFSEGLTEATAAAARAALESTFVPENRDAWQSRPIVVGGDDFTAITLGEDAVRVAHRYLRAFATETARRGAPLPAAAGIAIVRNGFPFDQAAELAEKACKRAKEAGRLESRLAWVRVTTSILDHVEVPVWTLDALEALEKLTAPVAMLPRGKLRAWAVADAATASDAGEQWARLREVADDGLWFAFEAALKPFEDERRDAIGAALDWLHFQPASAGQRLWSTT